jgi:hypothetical protein
MSAGDDGHVLYVAGEWAGVLWFVPARTGTTF